jgi:murein DD-endopeptidase MepM/ murein hydrolase activator NlpD
MVLALILVLALVLSLVFSLVTPSAAAATSLDSLRKNATALADKKKEIQKELTQLSQAKANASEKKLALDQQIELTAAEIDNANALIEALEADILDRQAALEEATRLEAEQMADFRTRLRLMEETGDSQYLGVLLEADSFADLLGRMSTVQDIIDYDQKLLAQIKETKDEIDEEKAQLEAEKVEQDEAQEQRNTHRTELLQQNSEQQALIKELESEEAELRRAIDAQEKAEAEAQKEIQKELARIAEEQKKANQTSVYVGGDFLWPCPSYTRISSEFGMRWHPILHEYRGHKGVDLAAASGTSILAANAGTVITVAYNAGGYGNYVVIDHGGGRATLYAHMSKTLVTKGQAVKKGDKIGLVGMTGLATGPHLHFEVLIDGIQVNPMQYFSKAP